VPEEKKAKIVNDFEGVMAVFRTNMLVRKMHRMLQRGSSGDGEAMTLTASGM
jgi:hypothetical protein